MVEYPTSDKPLIEQLINLLFTVMCTLCLFNVPIFYLPSPHKMKFNDIRGAKHIAGTVGKLFMDLSRKQRSNCCPIFWTPKLGRSLSTRIWVPD